MSLRSFLIRYKNGTRGATAIEYGLIAATVSLAIAAAVYGLGDAIYELFYSALPDILG